MLTSENASAQSAMSFDAPAGPAQSTHTDTPEQSYIARAETLNAYWHEYVDLSRRQESELRAFAERTGDFISAHDQEHHDNMLGEHASKLVNDFIESAKLHFAPPGGLPIEFDADKLNPYNRHYDQTPDVDFVEVAKKIVSKFGGSLGHDEVYKAAAVRIIREFWLTREKEIKHVGGNVELHQRVYVEKHSDHRSLSYNDSTDLIRLLDALKTVACWSGLTTEAEEIGDWQDENKRFGNVVKSGEKFPVSGAIMFITRFEYFAWRFSPYFANVLQRFISLYGTEYLNSRI